MLASRAHSLTRLLVAAVVSLSAVGLPMRMVPSGPSAAHVAAPATPFVPPPVVTNFTIARDYFHDNNILAIVQYNRAYNRFNVTELYRPLFPRMVYTWPNEDSHGYDVVHCPEGVIGYHVNWCVAQVMELYPDYGGYLMFHFDVFFQYWNFVGLDPDRIWRPPPFAEEEIFHPDPTALSWNWWSHDAGVPLLRQLWPTVDQRFKDSLRQHTHNHSDLALAAFSDICFIPQVNRGSVCPPPPA
eukprot:TRINITY_DN13070_c0_g1_i1.p2 TRINITY_DN13070_c0_g1~~TRINITY_DN13070_c0_g1_i1.p2  ORF type:complete len:242 (-),score=44.51 TRINITY_DN13070_c0_g1_i1:14-739(-)